MRRALHFWRPIVKLSLEVRCIEDFLDQVAEFFDGETPVSPETLFEDLDGYAITARAYLQRIRLHEALECLRSADPTFPAQTQYDQWVANTQGPRMED